MNTEHDFNDSLPDSAGERPALSSANFNSAPFAKHEASAKTLAASYQLSPPAEGLDIQFDESWSIPWSDLMMVMFVLFATLLIIDMYDHDTEVVYEQEPVVEEIEKEIPAAQQFEDESPVPNADLSSPLSINVFEESQQAVRTAELADVEIALLNDQSVKVSVQGPMLFELGKADLRAEVKSFLDSLAYVIQQTPFEVRVIGHTDDQPINTQVFPSNWELSLVRASRVARYLIRAGELDPTRFVVMGRGQYAPVAPNADDDSRALNRRVEIIITRSPSQEAGSSGQDQRILVGD